MMDNLPVGDIIKTAIMATVSGIYSYFQPIHSPMKVLLVFTLIDVVVGLITDINANGEKFRFKKFILAGIYALIYLSIIALIYFVGVMQGDLKEALQIVKITTYVFIGFYGVNILGNLTELFPNNRTLRFLYYIFGLEFTKRLRIPEEFFTKKEIKREKE